MFDSRVPRVWFAVGRVSLAQHRVSFADRDYKSNKTLGLQRDSCALIVFNLFFNL